MHQNQMVRLRADVAETQDCVSGQLALDGKEVVLVIRIGVCGLRRRHSGLRKKWRKIYLRFGVVYGSVEWGKDQRERLAVDTPVRGTDKGGCKQGRRGAGIA